MPSLERYAAVLVLPARNEAQVIERSIRTVTAIGEATLPKPWLMVVVNNGSTDATATIASRVAAGIPHVRTLTVPAPGKGRAIRTAWRSVEADYYFFTDVDLSVDLRDALPRLLAALRAGAELAVGARTIPGAVVTRPLYRRCLSLGYAYAARIMIGTALHDLPCGLKGIRAQTMHELLPAVVDQSWFFDSELLLVAESTRRKIVEVPVRWVEYRYAERQRTVPIMSTVHQYLAALWQLRKRLRVHKTQLTN